MSLEGKSALTQNNNNEKWLVWRKKNLVHIYIYWNLFIYILFLVVFTNIPSGN